MILRPSRVSASVAMLVGFCSAMLYSPLADAEESVPLPVVGVEVIDQGSSYTNSGGGPVGDPHPESGTGRQLTDDDGTKVVLDFRGNSLVVDLGQLQRVRSLRLRTDKPSDDKPFRNLIHGNLVVYGSTDNKTFHKIEGISETLEPGEEASLLLSGFDVEARYLKVHSLYLGNAYAVVATANKMLSAFGVAGPPAGSRVRLDFGLLRKGSNPVRVNVTGIRPSGHLGFRFQLWPYICEPGTKPIESGEVTLSSGAMTMPWNEASFTIPDAAPGFYQLTVECYDKTDGTLLWHENFSRHLVSDVRRQIFPGSEEPSEMAAGEALIVTPAPTGEPPKGWTVDRSVPHWPLWTVAANRVSELRIPVALSGTYAVYLGVRGGGNSAEIAVGDKTHNALSSAGHSPDSINEMFFGVVSANDIRNITIRSKIRAEPLGIAYLKILALTPAQTEVAMGKSDAFRGRKLIFYCDGYSIHGGFNKPSNFTAEKFESYADQFRDSADIVERFDFGQGTSSVISSHLSKIPTVEYPGETGFFYTKYSEFVGKNFKENFVEKGLNPIEVMGKRLHKHNVPIYAGYRMNAWYGGPMAKHYVSTYWRAHPEFLIQPYRGKVWANRSYAYPEVRKLNLKVIREMLGLGLDGIHLEFMRHPPFVGYDTPLLKKFREKHGKSPLDADFDLWDEWHAAQTEVMTSFVRQVRELLDAEGRKQNKRFGLTVRFDAENYRSQSLDVETWAREGLVDALIPGDNTLRNHRINLAPFQKMTKGTDVKVYSSLSPEETGTRDPTPEDDRNGVPPPQGMIPRADMKGFVANAFRQGADGVYMFNNGGVGSYYDWRQFRGLERWDIYENPNNLAKFYYSNPDLTPTK